MKTMNYGLYVWTWNSERKITMSGHCESCTYHATELALGFEQESAAFGINYNHGQNIGIPLSDL